MKKVLFVATVVKKHISVFHVPYLKMLQDAGYETYVAAANDTGLAEVHIPGCDHYIEIDFKRNPLGFSNLISYFKLKKIVDDNNFDIIHCHTPVGGVIGRLVARKTRKKGTKVLYTAHGFHFYKGAPLRNWLLYYTIEYFCSFFTDELILINKEDYAIAQKMHAKKFSYLPGIGIDIQKFNTASGDIKKTYKKMLGITEDSMVLLSIGELNKNKNHEVVIKALSKMNNPKIHYVIAGAGDLEDSLKKLVETNGLSGNVHLLGYRTDIADLCKMADVYIHPSLREGLPVSVMEAMASGLPCIVSKIRGNVDLIDSNGGILFNPKEEKSCKEAIEQILTMDLAELGSYNRKKVKLYELDNTLKMMWNIYSDED